MEQFPKEVLEVPTDDVLVESPMELLEELMEELLEVLSKEF